MMEATRLKVRVLTKGVQLGRAATFRPVLGHWTLNRGALPHAHHALEEWHGGKHQLAV